MSKYSELADRLDAAAEEIAGQGIAGWGNSCADAATAMRELEAERDGLKHLADLLYKGHAVYCHLPDEPAVQQRTSRSNVSDALDALARAWRAALEGK